MTKKELKDVLAVLERIKAPDAHVMKALSIINKNIEEYNSRKGQLRDQYEVDYPPF